MEFSSELAKRTPIENAKHARERLERGIAHLRATTGFAADNAVLCMNDALRLIEVVQAQLEQSS